MSNKKDTQISGMIGVFYIAMELSRRGFVAIPTIRNVKSIDLLVTNDTGTRTISLQVKTNKGNDFPIV